jgi:hypothetical protein
LDSKKRYQLQSIAYLKKRKKWLQASAVIGFFPANRVNDDDIVIYGDDTRTQVKATLHPIRQQMPKTKERPNMCLADFIAPIRMRILLSPKALPCIRRRQYLVGISPILTANILVRAKLGKSRWKIMPSVKI